MCVCVCMCVFVCVCVCLCVCVCVRIYAVCQRDQEGEEAERSWCQALVRKLVAQGFSS
jgi:hypothetical protein